MSEDVVMTRAAAQPRGLDRPYRFDLVGAVAKRDPFPQSEAMRAAGPVIPIKLPLLGKAWLTTTHAAALAMVKDNALFVQEGEHAGKAGVAGMQWWMPRSLRLLAVNMLQKDEPDHRRLRKLVDKAFARRDILAMRGRVEQIADRILDGFEARAEADLANAFSRRLPLEVICELLGLPDADRAEFSTWSRVFAIKNALDMVRVMGAVDRMGAYLRGQIEACRRTPRPGLIGELVRDEEDGDRLSEDELLAMVFLLLIAGFETTTHLISDSIIALEQHPEQKAFLLADPAGRMEHAVEELARFTTPVQSTKPRYVARDTEFFGATLRRGDLILAGLASANSDPAQFDHPEQLRLDRFPNPHLVFSSGIHFCLGMQLARVETQSALARLYARFPALSIAPPDQIRWSSRLGIRGVSSLPARLRPAAAGKLAA
jgi:cytochrome P450